MAIIRYVVRIPWTELWVCTQAMPIWVPVDYGLIDHMARNGLVSWLGRMNTVVVREWRRGCTVGNVPRQGRHKRSPQVDEPEIECWWTNEDGEAKRHNN